MSSLLIQRLLSRSDSPPSPRPQTEGVGVQNPFSLLIYLYIKKNIYIYGCNLSGWAGLGQKSQKIPSFIVKNVHETPPPKRWGFFMFQCFFFFLIFAFFCLSFSSLPLLLDIFKPKNGPPNEVLGYYIISLSLYLSLSRTMEVQRIFVRQDLSFAYNYNLGQRHDQNPNSKEREPFSFFFSLSLSHRTGTLGNAHCRGHSTNVRAGHQALHGDPQPNLLHAHASACKEKGRRSHWSIATAAATIAAAVVGLPRSMALDVALGFAQTQP